MNTKKKNTTKKTIKPAYVVDMTWCEDVNDLKTAIIYAKVNGGVAITTEEFAFTMANVILDTLNACNIAKDIANEIIATLVPVKEEPWYKRLWKKIKRVFKK